MRGRENKLSNGIKWIGLIIATMVGAGYASGRELWEFFGYESGLAILIFTLLFIISCHVILMLSYELKTIHYLPVLQALLGKRFATIYDTGVMIYLFTTLFVMISGSGATFTIYEVPYLLGSIIMVIFVLVVIPFGMNGILSINRFILPLLIAGLSIVLILFIWRENIPIFYDLKEQSNWSSSIPFTSLNILPLIAILGAIGKEIDSKKEIYIASIGSGLILGVLSFLYNTSLVHVADQLFFYDIPLFAILNGYPIRMFIIMSILLWFAIYTTAITSLFGLIARLKEHFKLKQFWLGVIVIAFAIPFTFFGFKNLISYLYPLYGVINLYVLAMIMIYPILKRANSSKI
ncbi:YkvI family membrane protein [Bacillaceae bacterium W0354]